MRWVPAPARISHGRKLGGIGQLGTSHPLRQSFRFKYGRRRFGQRLGGHGPTRRRGFETSASTLSPVPLHRGGCVGRVFSVGAVGPGSRPGCDSLDRRLDEKDRDPDSERPQPRSAGQRSRRLLRRNPAEASRTCGSCWWTTYQSGATATSHSCVSALGARDVQVLTLARTVSDRLLTNPRMSCAFDFASPTLRTNGLEGLGRSSDSWRAREGIAKRSRSAATGGSIVTGIPYRGFRVTLAMVSTG